MSRSAMAAIFFAGVALLGLCACGGGGSKSGNGGVGGGTSSIDAQLTTAIKNSNFYNATSDAGTHTQDPTRIACIIKSVHQSTLTSTDIKALIAGDYDYFTKNPKALDRKIAWSNDDYEKLCH